MLTPGRRNEFIDYQKAKVRIDELHMMEVRMRWNSTLELIESAYLSGWFTSKCLQNPTCSDYRLLFTTKDEWTIIKCVMEVARRSQYRTLWMLKRHTITLPHVITVYNDMSDHMDGVMRTLAKKMTQWKEDIFFAMKFAQQKLWKYYSEVTPMTALRRFLAHILTPFRNLRSFGKWDKGMDINLDDETCYTTPYPVAFLKDVENENCAKHRRLPVTKVESIPTNRLIFSAMASGSGQSCYDPYHISCDDQEHLMPNNVAETTPGRSDHAARSLPAAGFYLNSTPELPPNWGQINSNLNDYDSDPIRFSSTFWIPDITDWWRQLQESHSKYDDFCNLAREIFSIIPHGVGVEPSVSLGRDVIK